MTQTASRNKYLCGQYLDTCAEPHETKPNVAPSTPPSEPPQCRPRSHFASCATGPGPTSK